MVWSSFQRIKMMKYVLISLVAGFAVACGGGGNGQQLASPNNPPATNVEEPVGLYALAKGKSIVSYPDTRTVLRSLDDFKFYYRMFTGAAINEQYYNMSNYDILMFVHNQSVDSYFLTVDKITATSSNTDLNVYYYTTSVNVQGMYTTFDGINTTYQFYTVPKTTGNPTFTKIVK
jgi:hypothetical protein